MKIQSFVITTRRYKAKGRTISLLSVANDLARTLPTSLPFLADWDVRARASGYILALNYVRGNKEEAPCHFIHFHLLYKYDLDWCLRCYGDGCDNCEGRGYVDTNFELLRIVMPRIACHCANQVEEEIELALKGETYG